VPQDRADGKRDIGFGLVRPAKFAVPLIEEAKKHG